MEKKNYSKSTTIRILGIFVVYVLFFAVMGYTSDLAETSKEKYAEVVEKNQIHKQVKEDILKYNETQKSLKYHFE